MIFSEFPFLRYVIFFIGGILTYTKGGWGYGIPVEKLLLGLLWVYLVFWGLNMRSPRYVFKPVFPILALGQLFFAGIFFAELQDPQRQQDHLLHAKGPMEAYTAVVLGLDEQKARSKANRLKLLEGVFEGKRQKLKGEILIYHQEEVPLSPGDIIMVKGSPSLIAPAANPFEFDYRAFLLRQGVAHQHFVRSGILRLGKINNKPIENFFLGLRDKIASAIDVFFQDGEAAQIAHALLLGQKKNLDKNISEAYAIAGTMHILAVSGLHVGIVYGFFFLFVKPYQLSRRKRAVFLLLIIGLIWGYALLTGMSPSVMRAATMFSLMGFAQMLSRSPSIFSAISVSALVLLVFDPYLVFSVGFQLSYLALMGILLIQPLLVRLWVPSSKVLEYFWQISTVSLAAQLSTFPLSAYYFHTFPTYFLLANLLAIPGAFLVMSFGVPMMVFHAVPILGQALAWMTEHLIVWMNRAIFLVQHLPWARMEGLWLEEITVWLYFAGLGLLICLANFPGRKLAWTCTVLAFGLGGYGLGQFLRQNQQSPELIVYSTGRDLVMDYFDGSIRFSLQTISDSAAAFRVSEYRLRKNIESTFHLLAFQQEQEKRVLLPDGGLLKIRGDTLDFSSFEPGKSIFLWENGRWKPTVEKTWKRGDPALKIRR